MKMLGRQIATARRASGYTQVQLALIINIDEETMASIEQGRRPLKPDIGRKIDKALGTKGVFEEGAENLPEIDQYPMYAELYIDHERSSIVLSWYDCFVMPGLLQTEEYAEAVLREQVPAYPEDEIQAKLAGRIERLAIFERETPPTMSFIIWEPVLHLMIGGPDVRLRQLRHLRELADRPNVTIQILPLNSPHNAGLDGPFTILVTEDHQHLVYTESQRGSHWVSDPDEMSTLESKYAMLRTQARDTEESKRLMDCLLGEE
ncbi:helix-turn-helix domain-containing protein [Streptomyces niveiscabiei]|uniref:helix-turn-helix domain-containing protein n=1 Tax=Streptomyces niveiscabiei TaxID=164115 RepID=UPI00099E9CA1|nr:helix-turn-helix transcriptional regulator [Streptomyces niveiscabiei]